MVEKITFSSIKNPPSSEDDKKIIKCSLCDGVVYEPILSKKNRLNYCKTCFFENNNIDKNNFSVNYSNLYQPSSKEIKKNLNLYKFCCPNIDFEEKEYTYDELINHLLICENNKINCPSCGNQTFLKNIEKNEKQNLTKYLIRNKILERELEYQKSRIKEMEKEKTETNKIIKENPKIPKPNIENKKK